LQGLSATGNSMRFFYPIPGPLPRINGEGEARKEHIHKIERISYKKDGCRGVSLKRPLEISSILAKRNSTGQALQPGFTLKCISMTLFVLLLHSPAM
ncbi:MAG: hypothetical protein OXT68_14360, partial [Chloroflexota bacterium]|nr:hypothetical protein [Chloroflexota bacterium]